MFILSVWVILKYLVIGDDMYVEKYRTIIYESEGEINKVIDNCINHVLKNHPECTKEEILESIIKNKSDILNYDFTNELLMTEGKMLFDIAAAKFGEKLWNSNVELDNTCKNFVPSGICAINILWKLKVSIFVMDKCYRCRLI